MKTTDFAQCLASYLTIYLPGQLGLSENTVMAYRDTFKLVLVFAESKYHLRPEKITLADFSSDFIADFLRWLEQERGCSVATRNQRLAALRAFSRYARTQHPAYLFESQKIMDLKQRRLLHQRLPIFLPTTYRVFSHKRILLPNMGGEICSCSVSCMIPGQGFRRFVDLRVRDVRLQKPPTVILTGKGRKTRFVPIMASTANVLTIYFSDNGLSSPDKADQPLFTNHQRGKLTRAGVTYILKKYFDAARQANPDLPEKISPHILRHSKAMHMLQAGINLIYIRDFLGHVHVETTEIYAKADTEMKRRAIESTHIKINLDLPAWTDDRDLMALLTNLCGKD